MYKRQGYNAASAINRANKLNGELLLIHGTADDNVHLRNNAESVSYTHLDVYKRQVLLQEKKEESFKGKNA